MSRSNPTENNPNPASRFYEWSGEGGFVRYYDKSAKENVEMPDGFTFILLDQLSTVKGWHDASDSGIYSNEVKDIRANPLTVKAFKGGVIAEGFYSTIKDRVNAAGGHYVANLYIAVKEESKLVISSLQFKGAALSVWMEFNKSNRKAIASEKAVTIKGYTEEKKGKVTYRVPKFFLKEIMPETNDAATDLDRELQRYLIGYFARNRTEQVKTTAETSAEEPEDTRDHSAGSPDELTPEVDPEDSLPF